MSINKRIAGRKAGSAAAVAAVVVAGLAMGAGTASAKSVIGIGVGTHSIAVGRVLPVTASGSSDDFGGTPMQLCIDERVGSGGWQQLRCTSGHALRLNLRAQHRGEIQFRSQLVGVFGGHHRVVDRTSGAVAVWVH